MRSVEALLSHLSQLNIKVWSEEGELCYRCAKGSMTPELKVQLRENKEQILSHLDQHLPVPQKEQKIERLEGPGPHPLSYGQQRLWFLSRLEEKGIAYNMPAAWKIQGQLDEPALETALHDLMLRHRILGACFPPGRAGPN